MRFCLTVIFELCKLILNLCNKSKILKQNSNWIKNILFNLALRLILLGFQGPFSYGPTSWLKKETKNILKLMICLMWETMRSLNTLRKDSHRFSMAWTPRNLTNWWPPSKNTWDSAFWWLGSWRLSRTCFNFQVPLLLEKCWRYSTMITPTRAQAKGSCLFLFWFCAIC